MRPLGNPLLTAALLVIGCLLMNPLPAQLQRAVIDEELLSGLVQAKQDEIRARVLRNFVQKTIGSSNISTYNTVNDMLDILLTEKNKVAMTRDLVTAAAEYSIAYGITWLAITDRRDTQVNTLSHIDPNGYDRGFHANPAPFAEWREFRDAVKAESGSSRNGTDAGDKLTRTANSAGTYIIQYHDWLLDTTLALLRDPSKVSQPFADSLRTHGLFIRSKQRPWQGTVRRKHKAFIEANREHLDSVVVALKEYLQRLLSRAEPYREIAQAVGVLQAADLADLDISSLVGQSESGQEANGGKAVGNKEVAALFDLFRHSIEIYRYTNTENRFIAKLGDMISRYVILDDEQADEQSRFGFRIDVEAIILDMEDQIVDGLSSPTRNGWMNLRPYFTIGLNYGVLRDPGLWTEQGSTTGISTIAWAGEKLGVKWRIWDWKYTRGREPGEVFKFHGRNYVRQVRAREPLVNNWYANVFASGLLYTVADLSSESTFDDPILGFGTGITWFNELELNINYVVPLRNTSNFQENLDAGFWNVGFDIPIFDYIKAAREKKSKS